KFSFRPGSSLIKPPMWIILRRSFAFWFGVALVASGLGVVPQMLAQKREHERFAREGRVTDAPVLARIGKDEQGGDPKYFLEIQYYDEQRNQYPRYLSVSRELHLAYPRGSSLPVRYLPSAPEQMIPEPLMARPQWKETQR